jgi:amino acid adenylation domain-containing protein
MNTEFSNVSTVEILDSQTNDQVLCIHQMFEIQVNLTPDAIAVIFENTQLTYEQLNQRANQLANYLRVLGVGEDVLVGICLERSLEMIVGLLAILKAGGAYVPLDPAYPADRLAFILEDTQTPVLLTQEKFLQTLPPHQAQVICLDVDWEIIAKNRQENPDFETNPDHLIYTIYTSGSTGKPKGVMITHRGIYNYLSWRQTTFQLTSKDKVLQTITFSFDPSVWQIFWPLCYGAKLVLPRPGGHQDPGYLIKLIDKEQITVTSLVPSLLRVLLEEPDIEKCQCLRHISCGGEALSIELIERFFVRLNLDNVLHNCYGPTEYSIGTTFWTCQRQTNHTIAPIGCPIANTQIYILDENLQPVPVGEAGELHIGGAGLARGYLNRPQLTQEKFISNPFDPSKVSRGLAMLNPYSGQESKLYKTGDLARYLPDGNIEFLGRIDDQVKIRGFRIELGEITALLNNHPEIKTTVVIAREDNPGDKRLVAYCVVEQGRKLSASQIRLFLKTQLPEYMIPSAFVVLENLPLTPNGKIDRRALPVPEFSRQDGKLIFVAPRDHLEIQLTQIWEEVLAVKPIGITDNFFELGGNSLIAVGLFVKIEKLCGRKLPLATLFQAQTIEEFAAVISQDEWSAPWSSLVKIQPGNSKPPLFCVHSIGGNILEYYQMAHYIGQDQPVYGLQALGLDGKQAPLTSIEDMARHYIQEIRTIQPHGPYFLAGYSSAGMVVFEMSQQLRKQGEKVALLALLDEKSPKLPKISPSLWEYIQIIVSNLWQLNSQEKFNYVMDKFNYKFVHKGNFREFMIAQWSKSLAPEYINVLDANLEAARNYQPQVYQGKVTLFRCQVQPISQALHHDLGWSELVTGDIEIHPISGDHFNLLREPHVRVLATKLKSCLELLQSESKQ